MITGKVKFLERSHCLITDGADIELNEDIARQGGDNLSTDNQSIHEMLSFDRDNYFQTTTPAVANPLGGGYNDSFFLKLSGQKTFNRIMIVDTNITGIQMRNLPVATRVFNIDNQGVVGADGMGTGTGFGAIRNPGLNTLYFYFEQDQTQNEIELIFQYVKLRTHYFARQIIVSKEIGTFQGFPTVSAYTESQNEIINKTSTGLKHVTKQIPTIDSFKIRFQAHPIENDVTLSDNLFKSKDSFTLWPTGGGYGSENFLFEKDGWRLSDVFNVQTVGKKSHRWYKNFYKSGANTDINLVEVI